MQRRLGELRSSSEIGTALESLILNQIAAGERYLVTPDQRFQQRSRSTAAARTSSGASTRTCAT